MWSLWCFIRGRSRSILVPSAVGTVCGPYSIRNAFTLKLELAAMARYHLEVFTALSVAERRFQPGHYRPQPH